MQHLYALSDIKLAYHLRSLAAVNAWRRHPAFPKPVAVYSPSKRPLFDPSEVEAWVAENRPEYIARAAGEARA